MRSPAPAPDPRFAEAARYALLRRLAPAIRHNMAGALQPIGMIAAMLERRLQGAAPELEKLGKNARDLTELSREASNTCVNLLTWLAPREEEKVALHAGLLEILQLQATALSFRGFTLMNETEHVHIPVCQSALRGPVMAALIALTDASDAPAEVVFKAQPLAGETLLSIDLVATHGPAFSLGAQGYRKLAWADVQALADAEGIAIVQSGNRVELRLPGADTSNI